MAVDTIPLTETPTYSTAVYPPKSGTTVRAAVEVPTEVVVAPAKKSTYHRLLVATCASASRRKS